jgi:hypothetical protein
MFRSSSGRTNDHPRIADLSERDRHRLLASDRRRLVLDVLSERSDPVTLDELAAELATKESTLDASDEESVRRVKISLHHVHLPKMSDFGLLEYDADSHRIVS